MKAATVILAAAAAVGACLPTGCGSERVEPRPEAGLSPTDAPAEDAASVFSRLDGGVEETGAVAGGDATDTRDAGGGDSADRDDLVVQDGRQRAEGDVAPDGDGLEDGGDGGMEERWDTQPDSAAVDGRSVRTEVDDGDTGSTDAADISQDFGVSDGLGDVAEAREGGQACDMTGSAEGGASSDAGNGERIWVYLLAGQSNMVGAGSRQTLTQEDAAVVPGASIYYSDPMGLNQQAGQWLPLGPGFGVTSDYFGPEVTFARRLRELYPHRRLAIIKVAEGGTGLFDRWKATTGDLYQLLLRETRTQLGVLAAEGRPQLAGLVWMQGESDASAQIRAESYQENLTDFILALRSDLSSTLLPVVAGLIAKDHGWPFVDQVREATGQVAAQLGRIEVVETDDLRMNWDGNAHYDADGNLRLGHRFAEAMDSMQATRWRFPEDFSAIQGEGCFRYRDRTDSGVLPLVYDEASTRWAEEGSGVTIGPGFMIPATDRQAELAFWAPFAGDIEVTFRTTMPSAGSEGVGIEAASPNGVLAGPAGLAFPTAVWLSFHLAVAQGDEIFFRTSPGSAPDPDHDTTNWQIDISMTRVDE